MPPPPPPPAGGPCVPAEAQRQAQRTRRGPGLPPLRDGCVPHSPCLLAGACLQADACCHRLPWSLPLQLAFSAHRLPPHARHRRHTYLSDRRGAAVAGAAAAGRSHFERRPHDTHPQHRSAAGVAPHTCCTTGGRLDHLPFTRALPVVHTQCPSSPHHCCRPLCLLPLPPGYCDTQLLSHPLSLLRMRLAAGAVDLALQAPPSAVGAVVSKPGELHVTPLATA